MADIVTVKGRWPADGLLKAIEKCANYFDARDDAQAIYTGRMGFISPLTAELQDAYETVTEIRATEREEEFEAEYPNASQAAFDERFPKADG